MTWPLHRNWCPVMVVVMLGMLASFLDVYVKSQALACEHLAFCLKSVEVEEPVVCEVWGVFQENSSFKVTL